MSLAQVMKKQKTPAKRNANDHHDKTSTAASEKKPESDETSVNSPDRNNVEPVNSQPENPATTAASSVNVKKQIQFDDSVVSESESKEKPVKSTTKAEKTESLPQGSDASTAKTQPKRPRSRIAAKFN